MATHKHFLAKLAILLVVSIITVFLRLHSLGEPLERDLTTYAYVAHHILAGEKLYSYLWDHKPPAIYWVYMLAELIWGYDSSAMVYLGIFTTIISLFFLFFFLKRIAGINVALVGSTFWALASNSVLLQANQNNVEVFLNTFTLASLWSFSKYCEGKKRYLFLSGLFLSIASLFKIIAIFPLAAIWLYLILPFPNNDIRKWLKESVNKFTIIFLPFVVTWLGIFLYFAFLRRLGDFWAIVVTFNRLYSGNLWLNVWNYFVNPQLFFHPSLKDIWILVILSSVWFFVSRGKYGPLQRSFFMLLLFGLWVEVASPGKYFPHYYQLLIPPCAILSSLFFSDFAEFLKARNKIIRIGSITFLFLFSLGYLSYYQISYLKMTPIEISQLKYGPVFVKAYDVAKYIQTMVEPCDNIYEWGSETGIYYYTKTRSASGMFYISPLSWTPSRERNRYASKVFEEVTSSPPAIFIWNDDYGKLEESMFSRFIKTKYTFVKDYKGYAIYEYKLRKVRGDGDC